MATETRERIERRLREAGLKLTPQRFAVLDYLARSDAHLTADEISAGLNRRFPRASRATVYNTLHALRDAGLVNEVYMDDAVARYDANLAPHYHFICRLCERLEDVPAEAVGALARYDLPSGYEVEDYDIILRGVCAACARRKS